MLMMPAFFFEMQVKARQLTDEQVQQLLIEHDGENVKIDETHPAWCSSCSKKKLGDRVADGLAAFGITPERVSKIMGRDCGCKKRKQKLNELHDKAANLWSSINGKQVDNQKT